MPEKSEFEDVPQPCLPRIYVMNNPRISPVRPPLPRAISAFNADTLSWTLGLTPISLSRLTHIHLPTRRRRHKVT